MQAEQTYFIEVLRDHMHRNKTAMREDLDWEKIGEYAEKHQVEGIFFMQTGRKEFRDSYFRQILYSDYQNQVMEDVEKKLAGIDHFILKGPLIAAYYPVRELRSMGDIDFVFHLEDREKAGERLTECGFELTHTSVGEWEYTCDNVLIELHTALVYEYSNDTSDQILRDFFNGCWDYYKDGKIDFNFHILFLFMHLRKHIMETGVGFRQFMDIAILSEKADIDWKWIGGKAAELGLLPFVQTVLSLNEKWFGTKPPIETEGVSDAFFESATQHIFDDGVFGFDNEENEFNFAINQRRKEGNNTARVREFIGHVFLPYDRMIQIPEFEWLSGKKILLPAAWAQRLFLRWKKRDSIKQRYFASEETVEKRYEYLKEWGIENERE